MAKALALALAMAIGSRRESGGGRSGLSTRGRARENVTTWFGGEGMEGLTSNHVRAHDLIARAWQRFPFEASSWPIQALCWSSDGVHAAMTQRARTGDFVKRQTRLLAQYTALAFHVPSPSRRGSQVWPMFQTTSKFCNSLDFIARRVSY